MTLTLSVPAVREPAVVPPAHSGFSVVSLNLARERDFRKILQEIKGAAAVRDAGVFLFQETMHAPDAPKGVAGELARALGMHIAFAPASPGVYDQGLAILSRYPIRDSRVRALKKCNLRFRCRTRFALAATLDTPSGPVRVWNVHLDTRINAGERLEQLAPVVAEAAASPGPAVIGGDFNTNNFYWLGNVLPLPSARSQTEAVRGFMQARGFSAPFQKNGATFDHLGMRLDWIYQKELDARGAAVHPMRFSDHHALVVVLKARPVAAGSLRIPAYTAAN